MDRVAGRGRQAKLLAHRATAAAALIAIIGVATVILSLPKPGILANLLYAALILGTLVGLFGAWKRPAVVFGVLLGWFTVQKLVAIIAAPYVVSSTTVRILLIKEFMYLGLPLLGAIALLLAPGGLSLVRRIQNRKPNFADIAAVTMIALVAISFLVSPASFDPRLTYARRLASLPIIYLAGRLLVPRWRELRTAMLMLVAVGAGVAVLGFVELLAGNLLWVGVLHIAEFQRDMITAHILPSRAFLINGLPANWTTQVAGIPLRRLVSVYAEPTTLASFLALTLGVLPFTLQSAPLRLRRLVLVAGVLVAAALILTFGKGGILTVLVIGLILWLAPTQRSFARSIAVTTVVVAAAGGIAALLPLNLDRHASGLISGMRLLLTHPFGAGLGTSGGFGTDMQIATDSTFGVLASQLGFPGLVAWIAFFVGVARSLVPPRASVPNAERLLRLGLAGSVLGLFAVSLLSESASGLLGNAFYVLLAGWTLSVLAVRQDTPRPALPPSARARPRVLFLAEMVPYPPVSGGRIVTWHLLNLYAKGYDVRLLSFGEVRDASGTVAPALLERCAGGVGVVPHAIVASHHRMRHAWMLARSIVSGEPLRVMKFSSREMQAQVENALRDYRPDLVHVNDLMMLQYAPPELPTVLVRHNDDVELYQRRAASASSRLMSIVFRSEARRIRSWESRAALPTLVLALSERDAERLRARRPDARYEVFRLPLEARAPSPIPSAPVVLSVGTLSWTGAAEGLLWFAEHCWPLVRSRVPDARWQIAGSGPPPSLRALDGKDGVEVLGFVPDLDPLFGEARASIVPLHVGAGIRIKLLDLFARGCPSVSTSLGAEGLGLESGRQALIEDEPTAFAEAVIRLLTDAALATAVRDAAFAYLREWHDPTSVAAAFDAWISATLAGRFVEDDSTAA